LIEHGSIVISTRKQFIGKLNESIYPIHRKLTGGKEELRLQYEPNVKYEDFKDKLINSLERDLYLKMTNIGPHRDDMSFLFGKIDIKKFGSQGQQRTSALSLKLAELQLVKEVIKESPILLLDDVLSELDRERQNYLLNSIGDIQTFLTCTGLEEFINHRFSYNKIFQVENGRVICEN
jgi:DNA replication and repair protein RecF